ncbi:hypothetical protein DL769_010305 [Monosporascus sp. CRB-8-3]|nr:hypothetical protein DL769_010305 [Monosporascus sp. CRB-8-3]
MAADDGRSIASYAAMVCAICKARKKKCDKVLPSCGYCVRPTAFSLASPHTILLEPATSEANLYRQALQIICGTGQFVDDISARYFQGIHRYLPVTSRTRFHRSLITLGATPSAGFSVLLLSICLATSSAKLGLRARNAANTRPVDRRSLHLATKSLLAQVQGFFPPSVHLIQAALLLAVYEYAHGRPDEAFVSIAGCARMAYAARIHLCNRPSPRSPGSRSAASFFNTDPDTDIQLQVKEAANTWWGIIVCERTIFCEVSVSDQPLVTVMPGGDAQLPTEPDFLEQSEYLDPESIPYIPVSSLSSVGVGGFGRAAQAAWLLAQVLKCFEIESLDSRTIQLQDLDTTLQAFLGVLIQPCSGTGAVFCEAIAITIRALFTLHWHILSQSTPPIVSAKYQSLEKWCNRSQAALDTVAKMVVDVVEAHENLEFVAPSYSYIIRAALKHIYGKTEWKDESWLRGAEERLRTSLDQFNYYWNVNDY